MMRSRFVGFSVFFLAALVNVVPASAQATEGEMRLFPMPPTQGFVKTKSFQFVGDYSYDLGANYATFPTSAGPAEYTYYRYTNVVGKNINIWPRVQTPIPPPVVLPDGRTGDACFHTHLSYGVWAKFDVIVAGVRITGEPLVGGGGMSGVRNAQGVCELRTNNNLVPLSPGYGWGTDFTSLNVMPGQTFVTELVVGVSAPTHGWGTCAPQPGFGFRACFEPVWVNVWTLPTTNASPNLGLSNSLVSRTLVHWTDFWPTSDRGVDVVTASGTFPPTCPLRDIVLEMVDRSGTVASRNRSGGPPATMGNAGAFITVQNLGTNNSTVTANWWYDAYNVSRYHIRYMGFGLGCP